ncbi:SLC13 family permease [Streptomyces cirratus]
MITVSAMYPLYKRLGLSLVVMTGVAATANGVMNTLPWGGPTARAATALKLDAADIFVPMIPALAMGLVCVLVLAYVLGVKERRRVGTLVLPGDEAHEAHETHEAVLVAEPAEAQPVTVAAGARVPAPAPPRRFAPVRAKARPPARPPRPPRPRPPGRGTPTGCRASTRTGPTLRPRLYWFNAALTVALLTAMIMELLPIPVLFLLGAALALTVNFPHMPDQKARVAAHADNVLNVAGMVFAAAVFTGVLTGTGMVKHMADWLVGAIPDGMGPHMALVTDCSACPDVLHVERRLLLRRPAGTGRSRRRPRRLAAGDRARLARRAGPAHVQPAGSGRLRARRHGKVEFGDHTRFTVKWAALTSLVVLAAGMLFGII